MKIKLPKILLKPSTYQFMQYAQKMDDFSFLDYIHGYIYARFPYFYIEIGTGEHPIIKRFNSIMKPIEYLFQRIYIDNKDNLISESNNQASQSKVTFPDTYHGKVVPLESAKNLVMVNEDINLPNLEQIIPYKLAKDIILHNPNHIVVLDCPCRSSRENPCLPLDVCLVIGEPFASMVIEQHPTRSRWITQDEAKQIIQEENQRGHVHHAFFKDAMLGRFYAICNCCSSCCGAMQAQRNGIPMLASSGYVCHIEEALCIGCGTCMDYCQFAALSLDGFTIQVDIKACMGCGVCMDKCDQGALALIKDPARGEPLEIFELMDGFK
jgi:ferredoxin